MKYMKKPIKVDAMQYTEDNLSDILDFMDGHNVSRNITVLGDYLGIKTLEGQMFASVNDYIIIGVAGEPYPCKPDIFKLTYDEVIE